MWDGASYRTRFLHRVWCHPPPPIAHLRKVTVRCSVCDRCYEPCAMTGSALVCLLWSPPAIMQFRLSSAGDAADGNHLQTKVIPSAFNMVSVLSMDAALGYSIRSIHKTHTRIVLLWSGIDLLLGLGQHRVVLLNLEIFWMRRCCWKLRVYCVEFDVWIGVIVLRVGTIFHRLRLWV